MRKSVSDDPAGQPEAAALKQGLTELGWVEGRNIDVVFRFAPLRRIPANPGDPDAFSRWIGENLSPVVDPANRAIGPPNATVDQMQAYQDQMFATMKAIPEYDATFQIIGQPSVNQAFGGMLLTLGVAKWLRNRNLSK